VRQQGIIGQGSEALQFLLMAICVTAIAWFPLFSITALPSVDYNEGWYASPVDDPQRPAALRHYPVL
jgi:hypothetical protein